MGIETANFISGLDKTWPTGLDPINKGDDHMRLIKSVLKSAFPGVDGDGFKKAITATTSLPTIAHFPASAGARTYSFDVGFNDGLLAVFTGNIGTSTISWD